MQQILEAYRQKIDELDYEIKRLKKIQQPLLEGWISATLEGTWVNYSVDYSSCQYYKDPYDRVYIKGLVASGAATIFTLPANYRPSERLLFTVLSHNGSVEIMGRVDVFINGVVYFVAGGNTYVSLDHISFRVS